MGVDDSKVRDVLDSFEKTKTQEGPIKVKEKEDALKTLAKYFVHGIGFSLIFTVLTIVWAAMLVVLVVFGFVIGLIIGLGLLLLFIGFINSALMSWIWDASMKTNFWSILAHGIVLFIALLIVGFIFIIPLFVDSSISTQILMLIIGSIPRGFVAKKVGEIWEAEGTEETSQYEGLENI